MLGSYKNKLDLWSNNIHNKVKLRKELSKLKG